MEVIIQSSTFNELLAKLDSIEVSLEPLKQLPQLLESFRAMGQVDSPKEEVPEARLLKKEIIDNDEAARILQISKRTLQRLRSSKKIPFTIIKRSCYYKKSEIMRLLRTDYSYSEANLKFYQPINRNK